MSAAQRLWNFARETGVAALGRQAVEFWPFPVRVTVEGGRQMYVDLRSGIGRGLFATGTFDMEAIKPALDALGPGGTFIDVGANVGFYSVIALDRLGAAGNVYSFEIDPRPLRCLRKTIAKFGLSNLHVIEAAVSDKDGALTFVPMAEHGHNRIDRSAMTGRSVRSVRLDTWAAQCSLSRLEAIKIDVEGAEKFVLEGAAQTISRFRPILVCEAEENTAGAFGYTPRDLIAQLEVLGYTTTWLKGVFTPTLLARPV